LDVWIIHCVKWKKHVRRKREMLVPESVKKATLAGCKKEGTQAKFQCVFDERRDRSGKILTDDGSTQGEKFARKEGVKGTGYQN